MKRLITSALFAISVCVMAGCSSSEPSNMIEGTDEQALLDYERMVEEETAMMSEDPGDTDDE